MSIYLIFQYFQSFFSDREKNRKGRVYLESQIRQANARANLIDLIDGKITYSTIYLNNIILQ